MALNYQLQQPKLYFAHTGITSRSDPFASVASQFNMPSLLETAPMGPQATGFQGEAYRLPDTAAPVAQAPSDSSIKETSRPRASRSKSWHGRWPSCRVCLRGLPWRQDG